MEYVKNNSEGLEVYAQSMIENKTAEHTSYHNWDVSYYPKTDMVQFVVSSNGFGSSQTYEGFDYSPKDIPLGFQGVDLEFVKENNGWRHREIMSNIPKR